MNRGCVNERLAKVRSLIIAPVLALAVTTCMWGVANAREFSNKSLHGGYGCLTTVGFNGSGSVIQLVFDGKGHITSGVSVGNAFGEVCMATLDPSGSSYTVNPDGTGTLTVQSKTVTAADTDETAICTLVTGASTHYAIVVESGGSRFDLSGLDPFFTGGGFTGTGDIDQVNALKSGACNRQVGG
jgi:hypothetical protein